MPPRRLGFLLPGALDTRTGGYGYDRQIIAGLRSLGWQVDVRELDVSFPFPTSAALDHARAVLADIADDTLVIVDGLAFGAMAEPAEAEARRLRLVGLVHHPLALETGLDEQHRLELHQSERRALATARAVIVTSNATAGALQDYDVPAQRIAIIEPGVASAPLATGSGAHSLALLCVASLTPRKGHDVLFAALADLKEYAWHLTCVGGTMGVANVLERMHAQLEACGIAGRVTFAGEGDDAMVSAAYSRADAFVLPTYYEGYGMGVAEALAHGLPVIGTRTGAIAELVGEQAGFVVSPGDVNELRGALRRLFAEGGLLQRLRAGALAARERLPRWETSCRKLAAVLTDLHP